MRVPALLISPFSQGGFVCRETFDHTSALQFLERRFGVEVPHLTDWRRSVTGDLTAAFNFVAPRFTPPSLPLTPPWLATQHPECATEEATMAPSPMPTLQRQPRQEPGHRRSPSGLHAQHER
jgi:phospholipase C